MSAQRLFTIGLLAACLFTVSRIPTQGASREERQFLWEEANAQVAAASMPEQFLAASDTYRAVVQAGARNGPLFYNLGTALVQAEQYDDAVHALRRAERYMGSSGDIRRNMVVALSRREATETANLRWYRPILFWHFGLATRTRVTIALTGFALFWLVMALRLMGVRRGTQALLTVSILTFAVFASSVAASLHAEGTVATASVSGEPALEVTP